MSWVAIRMKRGNQGCDAGCENNQIAGARAGAIRVRLSCRHEYRRSGADLFRSVGVAKRELAFQYVPSFVIRVMEMQGCRATAPPLMNGERIPRGRERCWLHFEILNPQRVDN